MSIEGADNVGEITPIEPSEDGNIKLEKDEKGQYPKVVPWSKYVGIKESLGGKLQAAEDKVKSLEEQLKNAPNAEEFNRIKTELDETKGKLQTASDELKGIKEKSVSELKVALSGKGLSAERIEKMSEAEMRTVLEVLGDKKPAPDLGSGGGSGELKGSPMDLARRGYEESGKNK